MKYRFATVEGAFRYAYQSKYPTKLYKKDGCWYVEFPK